MFNNKKKAPQHYPTQPSWVEFKFSHFPGITWSLSSKIERVEGRIYTNFSLSLSLLIPSLFSFFFRYWELCVYAPCWERRRETCPADGPWSSQQRFPVESLSSRIQTGVEELRPVRVRPFFVWKLFNNVCSNCDSPSSTTIHPGFVIFWKQLRH